MTTYTEVGGWSDLAPPPGCVVVGYHGKEHSRVALTWAVEEAIRQGAALLVVFAANYPGMTGEPGPGLLAREPGALEAAYEVTARGVEEALRIEPGLEVYGATEVEGPVSALVAASNTAAVVVLGNRGRGRVAGALLGSVAFTVAARAPCPVLVVKDEALAVSPGPERPVIVGTDGSPAAAAAVGFAAWRAATFGAPLHVVTCTGGHLVPHVDEETLRASADRIARDAAGSASAAHPGLVVSTRVEDCPAEVTLVAASEGAGLVVVGTRGRGAFEGLLLGSVSHAVIHGSSCVVAVV